MLFKKTQEMNKYKLLFLLLVVLFGCQQKTEKLLPGQITEKNTFNLTNKLDIVPGSNEIIEKIFSAIESGKLKSYENDSLNKVLSPQEFKQKCILEINELLVDTNKLVDMYSDTTIYHQLTPDSIDQIILDQELSMSSPQTYLIDFNAIALGRKQFVYKNIYDTYIIAWINKDELKELLGKNWDDFLNLELKAMMHKNISINSNSKKAISKNIELTDFLGDVTLFTFNKKLWQLAKNNAVKTYSDPQLKKEISFEQIKAYSQSQLKSQYAPDPDDPEYLIDTLIITPFSLNDINSNQIGMEWRIKNEKITCSITAFGPAFHYIHNDLDLGNMPLFYIDFGQLPLFFNDFEFTLLTRALFYDFLGSNGYNFYSLL